MLVLEELVSSGRDSSGNQRYSRFHKSDTIRAFYILRRVLTGRQKDRSQDISGVSIETTHAAGHRATNQVLLDIDIAEGFDRGLQYALDDFARDDGFGDDTLASALDPVDGRRFLVCAVIATESEDDHLGELRLHNFQSFLGALRDHVHAHSITSGGCEADV